MSGRKTKKQKNKRKSAVVGDNERLTKRGLIYLGK